MPLLVTITYWNPDTGEMSSHAGDTAELTYDRLIEIDRWLSEQHKVQQQPGALAANLLNQAVEQVYGQYLKAAEEQQRTVAAPMPPSPSQAPKHPFGYLYRCPQCKDWGVFSTMNDDTCLFCNGALFYLPLEEGDYTRTREALAGKYKAFITFPLEGA